MCSTVIPIDGPEAAIQTQLLLFTIVLLGNSVRRVCFAFSFFRTLVSPQRGISSELFVPDRFGCAVQ